MTDLDPGERSAHAAGPTLAFDDLIPADLPAVAALFGTHTGRAADRTTMSQWIDRWPSAAARSRGSLVGYVMAQRFGPDVLELTSVLVAPGERSAGVGRHLVGHVEASARRQGQHALIVVTSSAYATREPAESARGFYESLGFRAVVETSATSILAKDL